MRLLRTLAAVMGAGALAAAAASPAHADEWVAGDLHVHTTYSHDSYGGPGDDNTGPDEGYALGNSVTTDFALAASRGLGFLAISDHNDVRSQSDPGFGSAGVVGLPAYENSLQGHAQMLGARRIYDAGDKSTAAVRDMVAALRADGGLFQANHPSDPVFAYGYDIRPDTVEVWNLPRVWKPPLPSASDNDAAIRYWEGWLDRGHKVAATGGSDSHFAATLAVQGPGQPTTWVRVRERTAAGVLDGLRAGRTFVSHQPPGLGGPRVLLEADGDRDGRYEATVGDTVAPGTPLRVRVQGGPGAKLELYADGGRRTGAPVAVTGPAFEHRFTAPAESTWVRAEVNALDGNRTLMLGMTSALYLR